MNQALLIARDEVRFWLRSKLALAAIALGLILTVTSLISNGARVETERSTRERLQTVAEETFRSQPDRHPHRMVHYGHYVFRTPAPLSVIDPGVDPYTGTVVFLEGHHQNSATFSPFFTAPQAGAFAKLTPALAYEVFVPLVLIVAGFASMARERETGTDRQLLASGVPPQSLWSGKVVALVGLSVLLFTPLGFMVANAAFMGEAIGLLAIYGFGFLLYLAIWSLMIATASTASNHASGSFLTLTGLWLVFCVVAPPMAASIAGGATPMVSKIESDLQVAVALRSQGDGHNANDPAFNRLRSNLLEQYGVNRVEDLPINFRGVVAEAAEADLTDVMNRFAEKKMAAERAQANLHSILSVLSPQLALRQFSMTLAGTDLRHHHRFLEEAEHARFDFVQGLNRVHAEEMAYTDDINRSSDPDAERRTRVSAENWRVLDDFTFAPNPAGERVTASLAPLGMLALWGLAAFIVGRTRSIRLAEADRG